MIIIDTKDNIKLIENYPKEVREDIIKIINILGENYGRKNNIKNGMGGIILIIESIGEVNEIKKTLIKDLEYQYSSTIRINQDDVFNNTVYLVKSNYMMIIITKNEITDKLIK
mgnify:CR=1 FL=1